MFKHKCFQQSRQSLTGTGRFGAWGHRGLPIMGAWGKPQWDPGTQLWERSEILEGKDISKFQKIFSHTLHISLISNNLPPMLPRHPKLLSTWWQQSPKCWQKLLYVTTAKLPTLKLAVFPPQGTLASAPPFGHTHAISYYPQCCSSYLNMCCRNGSIQCTVRRFAVKDQRFTWWYSVTSTTTGLQVGK